MEQTSINNNVKQLLAMALADGILDKSEIARVFKSSGRGFLTSSELDLMMKGVTTNVMDSLPQKKEERARLMYELTDMMLADGEIHENEYRLCQSIGVAIGIEEDNIDNFLETVVGEVEMGTPKSKVVKVISRML
ncbi:MAG TPA: hypothetical protein DDX92_10700 [Flavobacteriales bacterium]|jgi:hypothetical protein|nr:hypothetical protein [Flavobacteriales bacterium]